MLNNSGGKILNSPDHNAGKGKKGTRPQQQWDCGIGIVVVICFESRTDGEPRHHVESKMPGFKVTQVSRQGGAPIVGRIGVGVMVEGAVQCDATRIHTSTP